MDDQVMPMYRGAKTLRARPMTRGDYNRFRGWAIPNNEDPAEPGYFVEYTDGGKPNVVGFEGYVSWSPADVFERTYKPLAVGSASDERTANNTVRHAYRVLTDEEKAAMQKVKDLGLELLEMLGSLGSSRELSIAKTRAEETVMWAVKHITA